MAITSALRRLRRQSRWDSAAEIRDAAMRRFAAQGVAATTMRSIAKDAGVSLGLVQHRFGTKERLVEAVDDYVLDVVQSELGLNASHGWQNAPEDSIDDTGLRVRRLISEYPEVVDYMARAIVNDSPVGVRTFDALFAMGEQRWGRRADEGQLHPDVVDVTWAALNPLLLALGTIILRRHVERQLPESFTEPTQLKRWEASVNALLRHGQTR